ncbi:MAG: choice-of-anchor J domain-containing protein [Lepagella sp.]
MKKFLSRIFSALLIVATVASPSFAQKAKKAVVSPSAKQSVVATKAPAKKSKTLSLPETKSISKSKFAMAKKHVSGPIAAPAKEAVAGMPQIYGCVVYNDQIAAEAAKAGLYEIPKDGANPTSFLLEGPDSNGGGVLIGNTYYSSGYWSFWGYVFVTVATYDIDEMVELDAFDGTPDNIYSAGLVQDPTTGDVYGIGYNADLSGLQLSKVDVSDSAMTNTVIASLEGHFNCLVCDNTGQLYTVVIDGDVDEESGSFTPTGSTLYKISKETGEMTAVGATGVAPKYLSSAVVDPKTNRMFWNVCPADEKGYMYEIDLATGQGTLLYQLKDNDEICGMFIPGPEAEDGAPAELTGVTLDFEGSSLSGSVNATAPTTTFDGTALATNVDVVVRSADDEELARVSDVAPGATVSLPLSVDEEGAYTFEVCAVNAVGDGPKTKFKNVWIGADTPNAPAPTLTYEDGMMKIDWEAVTTSVHDGFIDLEQLRYRVTRFDGLVVAEGLEATSFEESFTEPEALTNVYYTVEAMADGNASVAAKTNVIVLGAIVPPYTADFAEAGLEGWTVIDANEDGLTWELYENKPRVKYNSAKAMDDWLITPPMKLEAGKAYNVKFDAYSNSTSFPERIEVKYGKDATVEAMTGTILEPTDLGENNSSNPCHVEYMLMPEENGTYYVGFHGISDADMFYLYVNNISVEEGISTAAPGLATDVVLTPDPTGENKVNVAFKAPAKTMSGADLSSLEKVEVYRGSDLVKTFETPNPGAALSFDDETPYAGRYTYSIVGYNEEGKGLTSETKVYVGFDLPEAPANVALAYGATDGEVTVSWDAVTKDINGLTLPAGKVTYTIVDYQTDETVAEGLTECSYSYNAVAEGDQAFVQPVVYAVTDEGENPASGDMMPVGTPYQNLAESFGNAGEDMAYIWGLEPYGAGGTISILDDESGVSAQDGDNGFIGIRGNTLDGGASLLSGLVDLSNLTAPGLTFYTYCIDDDDNNDIMVSVREKGAEEYTELYSNDVYNACNQVSGEWCKITVSLADFAGKTIQFSITGVTNMYTYTIIDNIKVTNLLANDLAITKINAPAKVACGAEYQVNVTVSNEGANAASGYKINLYADGEVVATKNGLAIDPSKNLTAAFKLTMSPLAVDPINYYAEVVYDADENPDNDKSETVVVTPKVPTTPVATNLKATCGDGNITLTWSEPNLEGATLPVTEGFEEVDAFTSEVEGWTFIDEDQSPVGGFQGTTIPGITAGETLGSFWVWDATQVGNATFAAHEGDKYLFALFLYDDSTSSDWAISPELCGLAQTVDFYAKSYSASYPEKIEVYYSTGSLDPADFILVEDAGDDVVPDEWTNYSVDLPEGAKYFAIHSCATGSFMLQIDDVTYTPASSASLSIEGYNVYRDGVKINDTLLAETEFVDNNVAEGEEYTYVVTVVYAVKGESAASEECVVTYIPSSVNGLKDGALSIYSVGSNVVVLNAMGQKVDICSANGAIVYSGMGDAKTVVNVGSGVYVVKVGKTVKKLQVK